MPTDDEIRAALDGAEPFERQDDDGAEKGCLTVREWTRRKSVKEDLLLGAVFSTSVIAQFVADTGIGRTMLAIAIAFAVALGTDLMHWKAHRKARVLFIDGEMPTDLMKERIQVACKWFGVEDDVEGLYFLSREDFDDMPPLNTPEGHVWLDTVIERLGGVDFIIFDNIMSLTIGNLRETDSWEAMRPKVKDLQRRRIGQLWIHHVGHDKSRGYGDKTREWDIDATILGERVDSDADVAIKLSFVKARRRRPGTAADFEPVTVELRDEAWSAVSAPSKHQAKTRLSPNGRLAMKALEAALHYKGTRQWCTP
jgi:hypothetical protein